MATSTLPIKYKTAEKDITTGTSQFDGFYYAEDATYKAGDIVSATIVNVTNNRYAVVVPLSWTTRVFTATANTTVKVRFLLKE